MTIDSYKIIRSWLPRLITSAAILIVALTLYFIYQNVWQVFSSSKENVALQKEVISTELKMDLFRKIGEKIENKKKFEEISFDNIRNPFGSVSKEKKGIQIQQ